jgi:hypothetical protein
MRVCLRTAFLMLGLCRVPLIAQDKVAEGDYVMQRAADKGISQAKTLTRWVLYGKGGSGYHLNSEVENQPGGLRVVQVEELDPHFGPTAIGYELYRKDNNKPGITVKCQFSGAAITCGGEFEGKQIGPSKPYKESAPFWLWMEGLFALDMPWLLDGTVNMAHLKEGRVKVPTVSVLGGTAVLIGDAVNVAKLKEVQGLNQKLTVFAPDKPTEWEVYSDEESLLELVGTETVEINGAKISVRHYTLTNGTKPMGLWITDTGILIRMSGVADDGLLVLSNYKQYKNLIPELPVVHEQKGTP